MTGIERLQPPPVEQVHIGGRSIPVYALNGDLWVVLADLCELVGLPNAGEMLRKLPPHYVMVVHWPRNTTLVNETAMYMVIMQSRHPHAEAIQHEFALALKALRERGGGAADRRGGVVSSGDFNPMPAMRAQADQLYGLIEELERTRERSLHGVELGTRANERIDQVEERLNDPDRWVSARSHLEQQKIAYDSILNEYELMRFEEKAKVKNHMPSRNDYMTHAAAKVGKRCVALALESGISQEELDAVKFGVGNYAAVGKYPPEIVGSVIRNIMGG